MVTTPTWAMASVPVGGGPHPSQAMRLSSTFAPLPAKLVTKIRTGQFVEMRELLADNMALQRQLDTIHAQPAFPLPAAARPRMRDIDSPLTWIYCFLAYAAVRSSDPAVCNLLTYGRLVIREAQRHGGAGWREYDRVFRQQAALDGQLRWSELSPSLYAATILSARVGPSSFCTLCQEADHQAAQCALAFFHSAPRAQGPSGGIPQLLQVMQPVGALPPANTGSTTPTTRRAIRPETLERICVSWNKGRCAFPGGCTFRHVCASCRKRGHRARDCPETPEGSSYKARVGVGALPGPPDGPLTRPSP